MAAKSRNGKVTVVGAGFYGSTTALRLAEYDIFETVVLTDIVEGKPEGIALDMNQSRPIEGFETKIVGVGGGSYEGTEGSDVVVITAGLPRKPGMSRMDLIETNAKIVRSVRFSFTIDLIRVFSVIVFVAMRRLVFKPSY
jgi:malate dehydrogenase